MQSELIIKLLDGSNRYGILNQEFDPVSEYVDFFCTANQKNNKLELSEICFIKFLGKPALGDSIGEDEFFEEVTTHTGDRFHLRLKKSGKQIAQGFYGYPVEIEESDFKSIFFTSKGFKQRMHTKPLGEVLNQQGLVNEADLDEALSAQKELRKRRVGEIIAEKAEVPQLVVEQALEKAFKNGKKPKVRVGDILVEAGLVTNQQVEKALKDQASGKRKRIGLIMVEKGLITEDQLLEALAYKFGLKVIDLDEVKIDPQALKKVPRNMIVRMQSLPISLQGTTLTVATATPTDPTISENLRFATNCQIELVCARTTQTRREDRRYFQPE